MEHLALFYDETEGVIARIFKNLFRCQFLRFVSQNFESLNFIKVTNIMTSDDLQLKKYLFFFFLTIYVTNEKHFAPGS
jgi:hypothetical protein